MESGQRREGNTSATEHPELAGVGRRNEAAVLVAVVPGKKLCGDSVAHRNSDSDRDIHAARLAALRALDQTGIFADVDDPGGVGALHGPTPCVLQR